MFDDWAYQEVYALHAPIAAQESAAVTPAPQKRSRDRAVSIVRSVATSQRASDLPEPEVRPRARSFISQNVREPEKPSDTPLTRGELAVSWDRKKWLGESYDPDYYAFDSVLWDSKVAEFKAASTETRLAARIAREQHGDAQAQLQHVTWISHELQDVEKHDIAPLRALAKQQDELSQKRALVGQIKDTLSNVYDALERVTRVLRGPAPRVVSKLPDLFEEIDSGLAFCAAHPDFAETSRTAQGFKNCAKRAIDIAKAYSVHELRKVTEKVRTKVQANPGAAHALLFAKYESDAAHCSRIIALVANHAMRSDPAELSGVFSELQYEYFALRMGLIGSEAARYAEPLQAFTQLSDAFFDAARSSMVQFKQLFGSEHRLFTGLFGVVTPEFKSWLVDVSDPLYDAIRRLVVRETDVGRLCQLMILVHNESDDGNDLQPNTVMKSVDDALSDIDPFQVIYSDTQQRLVFRADMVIDSFSSYVPSAKDFSRARFPVVAQALGLLSQVYQLISSQVFNDLAHRCIRECVAALDGAVANRVSSGKLSGAPKVHLFHIKQLLILQSQIVDFDLEHTVLHEVDFSGIRRLLELPRGYSFRELLSLAWDSVPQVVEYMFDAMEELYASLRRALDRFCNALVVCIATSLQGHGKAEEKAAKFRDMTASQFTEIKAEIAEHIGDQRVAGVLLDSAQEAVVSRYTDFYNSEEEKNEQLMDPDMFRAWVSTAIADES